MLWGVVTYSKGHDHAFRERLVRPLETVEKWLATRTFLVGERLSLADISAVSVLRGAYSSILGKTERAKYPHTIRYYETIVNQPQIRDVLAGAELAETAQQYVPPPKEQKPKAEKEQKPKAEKPPPKPKAEKKDDDDDDEPLVPAEPKKKNPLDDLPKSDFNLEDWKRAYSNLDTRGAGGSLEWFYERYALVTGDPGGAPHNFVL